MKKKKNIIIICILIITLLTICVVYLILNNKGISEYNSNKADMKTNDKSIPNESKSETNENITSNESKEETNEKSKSNESKSETTESKNSSESKSETNKNIQQSESKPMQSENTTSSELKPKPSDDTVPDESKSETSENIKPSDDSKPSTPNIDQVSGSNMSSFKLPKIGGVSTFYSKTSGYIGSKNELISFEIVDKYDTTLGGSSPERFTIKYRIKAKNIYSGSTYADKQTMYFNIYDSKGNCVWTTSASSNEPVETNEIWTSKVVSVILEKIDNYKIVVASYDTWNYLDSE